MSFGDWCDPCSQRVDDWSLHLEDGRHVLNQSHADLRAEGFEPIVDVNTHLPIFLGLKIEVRGSHSYCEHNNTGRRIPSGNDYWAPTWAMSIFYAFDRYGSKLAAVAVDRANKDERKRTIVMTLFQSHRPEKYVELGIMRIAADLLEIPIP